jgi:uncharacterized protein with PIN domain
MKKQIFKLIVSATILMIFPLIAIGSSNHSFSQSDKTTLLSTLHEKRDTLAPKVVYTCPMHSDIQQEKSGKCPKCKMNLVQKEIKGMNYTCPMHSNVIQNKPGKCPKCGMNLVKKITSKK